LNQAGFFSANIWDPQRGRNLLIVARGTHSAAGAAGAAGLSAVRNPSFGLAESFLRLGGTGCPQLRQKAQWVRGQLRALHGKARSDRAQRLHQPQLELYVGSELKDQSVPSPSHPLVHLNSSLTLISPPAPPP
jgi:hypothetical protein